MQIVDHPLEEAVGHDFQFGRQIRTASLVFVLISMFELAIYFLFIIRWQIYRYIHNAALLVVQNLARDSSFANEFHFQCISFHSTVAATY